MTAVVYCWGLYSEPLEAILAHLEKMNISQCRVVLLVGQEALWVNLPSSASLYPLIALPDGTIVTTECLSMMPAATASGEIAILIDSVKTADTSEKLPPVLYLDKEWVWSELFLNFIETFGLSVGKSPMDDPFVPEDYLIACLERNIGIGSYKDGQLIVDELVANGMLLKHGEDEYRFYYHESKFCLNACRNLNDWKPKSGIDMANLVVKAGRISTVHSREFLEFVDALNFLRFAPVPCSVKALVDLHYVLQTHKDLLLRSNEPCYYEFLGNKKISCDSIVRAIQALTTPADCASIQSVLLLKWTLPTVDEAALKKLAVETVLSIDEKYAPRFLKPILKSPKDYYDIHLGPLGTG